MSSSEAKKFQPSQLLGSLRSCFPSSSRSSSRDNVSVSSAEVYVPPPPQSNCVKQVNKALAKARLPHLRLLLCVLVTSSLSVFPSYYFSIVNIASVTYKKFLDNTFLHEFDIRLCPPTISIASGFGFTNLTDFIPCDKNNRTHMPQSIIWGFTVAIYNVGSLIGCLLVPYLADNFGRRNSLMFWNNILALVSTLLMAFANLPAYQFQEYFMLVIGRFISGVATGICYGLLPLYLTEISPTEYRGFNASCQNLTVSLNSLFSLIVAHPDVLGSQDTWFWLHVLGVPFAVVQMALVNYFPETPKYLLLHKKDDIGARRSLAFFNPDINDEEVVELFNHFRAEELQASSTQTPLKDVIRTRHLRQPIIISSLVMIASMLTGIVVIFTYSTDIFESQANMSPESAEGASIGLSFCNCVGAVVATLFVERVGRRKLLLIGLIGCVICNGLFLTTNVIYTYVVPEEAQKCMFHIETSRCQELLAPYAYIGWLGVAVMAVHVTLYNVGPGAIAWFISSEMTPQSIRSIGVMVTLTVNNLALIMLNFGYPPLEEVWHAWAFSIFIIPLAFFTVVLYFVLPETRNREVDEIIAQWRPSSHRKRHFYLTAVEKDNRPSLFRF